jgi:hypothetical protein
MMRGCDESKLLQDGWLHSASHKVAYIDWLIETYMHSLLVLQVVSMVELVHRRGV